MAGPASARASAGRWDPQTGWTFPGQRPARERELDVLLRAADRFWTARNVRGPMSTLAVADSLADSDHGTLRPRARGSAPQGAAGPQMLLDAQWVGSQLATLRGGRLRAQGRALRELYGVMTHEEGHARGLPHSESGIMREGHLPTPGDWRAVARELGLENLPRVRPRRSRPGMGVG